MNPLVVFLGLTLAAVVMAIVLKICGYVFAPSDSDSASSEGVQP